MMGKKSVTYKDPYYQNDYTSAEKAYKNLKTEYDRLVKANANPGAIEHFRVATKKALEELNLYLIFPL